jgi:pimeloyl-ACP methyl ester carboxylesterase
MRVQVGDVKLFFDVEATKLRAEGALMREVPTLLLLHGGPGFDHSGFKPDFSQVADIAQIVYFDQRGCGRSERSSPEHWRLNQWADDIYAFCEALEIRQPIVLGQSFGGCTALAYAIRYPDHPSKLVISSGLVRPIGERVFTAFERLGGIVARQAAIAFWTNPGSETRKNYFTYCMPLYTRKRMSSDFFSRTVPNPAVADFFFGGELKTLDLLPHLKTVRCPTLVIGGEDDPVVPIEDVEATATALPLDLVRCERITNAGHGVFRDQPDAFFRILRDFICSKNIR